MGKFDHVPRMPQNKWWCSHHWAPYVDRGDANLGNRACEMLTHEVVLLADFTTEFSRVSHDHPREKRNWIAEKAVENIYKRTGRPMCCLVGDAAMERICQLTTR